MSTPAKTREAVREKPPPNKQKHTMSRPTIGSQHHSIYNTQISLQRNNAITAPHLANTLWFPLPTNTSGVHVHPNSTSTPLQCIANILAPCSTDTPQVNPPANTSKVPPHTNKDTISPPIGTTIHYVDKLVFHYQWQPLVHSNGATNTGNSWCGSNKSREGQATMPKQGHKKAKARRIGENKLLVNAPWYQWSRLPTVRTTSHILRPNVPDGEGSGPSNNKKIRSMQLKAVNEFGYKLDNR